MNKEGKWKLAPAYDIGFAFNPEGGWTSTHQMSINGKFDNITEKDLIEFGKKNNIKEPHIIIEEVIERASQWPVIAKECGVPKEMINTIFSHMDFRLKERGD